MLRTLEKYEILEEIGHGGMATVFRARDTKLDRLVALKVMHPHLRASKEARARFRREAQGVAKLRHPRVLEIYDYSGEDSEESFIATELLTGPTLKKFADDHPSIPAELAACFAIEVCRALGEAHDKGIIHRDVKPENILVHEDQCVKLTDFGIADMVDSHTMTATGQILGSPGHMAPEQIEGRDCDARTDVFSLGTVLYFLACGRLPFTGRNPHQVLKRIVDGDYADPLRVQPAIGGRLRAIIVRALAHDPAERFVSAAHLEKELREFVADVGVDDPGALLAEYLADPERVAAEVTKRTIVACTALGKKARDAGDVPVALDHFGRVLALDNGNAEVLALVESVGRTQRRSRTVVMTLGALGALAAVVVGGWVFGGLGTDRAGSGASAIGAIAAEPGDAGARTEDASAIARAEPDAGAPVALAEPDAGPTIVARAEPDAGPPPLRVMPVRRVDPPSGPPRLVRFDPDPERVRIGYDDVDPQTFGGAFSEVELAPGRHRFVIEPLDSDCCRRAEFVRDIPTGDGPYLLQYRLESNPAILIVRSAVGAEVRVGSQRGRTNESIAVVIRSPERRETVTYTVTAPGHREYRGQVDLVAGVPAEPRVVLEAEEPSGE